MPRRTDSDHAECCGRLRSLSDSGSSSFPAGDQYKLAQHRYGREELLALYKLTSSVCPDLEDSAVMLSKPVPPMALVPMSDQEQVRCSLVGA